MKYCIDAVKRTRDQVRIADVAMNELGLRIHILSRSIAVHLGHKQVEHAHTMTAID